MMGFVRRTAARIAALPLDLRIVLLVVAVVHGLGISWGMPASDAWDNDGVAPRDFLPGLASTYTPGDYYTYPPFHLALLALLTAPVTILAAVKAGSTRVPDVLHEIIQPPYMTTMAMTARIVALVMSLGIVLVVAKLAEEIAPDDRKRRAPAFAAAVAGLVHVLLAHVEPRRALPLLGIARRSRARARSLARVRGVRGVLRGDEGSGLRALPSPRSHRPRRAPSSRSHASS